MRTTKKIVIGLGIASGALLAAWLITGDRGHKTKSYIARRARSIKDSINKADKGSYDDSEITYI